MLRPQVKRVRAAHAQVAPKARTCADACYDARTPNLGVWLLHATAGSSLKTIHNRAVPADLPSIQICNGDLVGRLGDIQDVCLTLMPCRNGDLMLFSHKHSIIGPQRVTNDGSQGSLGTPESVSAARPTATSLPLRHPMHNSHLLGIRMRDVKKGTRLFELAGRLIGS